MGITLAVVVLLALVGFGVVVFGLVNRRRSIPLAITVLFVALLACGGAWYAWVESHSTAWTLGYATVAVVSFVASVRQCRIGRKQPTEQTERREEST